MHIIRFRNRFYKIFDLSTGLKQPVFRKTGLESLGWKHFLQNNYWFGISEYAFDIGIELDYSLVMVWMNKVFRPLAFASKSCEIGRFLEKFYFLRNQRIYFLCWTNPSPTALFLRVFGSTCVGILQK